MMHAKITAEHLARSAIVYVRQSTMSQVLGNLESQKRQYQMAEAARDTGFSSVEVIDEDLGRSRSVSGVASAAVASSCGITPSLAMRLR